MQVIHWKQIDEFIEPNWEKAETPMAANLFWRGKKGAVFGYIRDGELFDFSGSMSATSNKVTNFYEVNGPESNLMELERFRPDHV